MPSSVSTGRAPAILWKEIFPALSVHNTDKKCPESPDLCLTPDSSMDNVSDPWSAESDKPCHVDPSNVHERIKQIELIPLTVLILATNFVVLIFIATNRKFRSPTYIFVASLGIADLFVGFVSIVTIATKASERNQDLCLVRIGVTIVAVTASVWSLVCIAVDRYIAVTRALLYRSIMTNRNIAIGISSTWLLALLIGFIPLMGWRLEDYGRYCSFMHVLSTSYILFIIAIIAILPFTAMLVIYTKLFRSARIHIKRIQALEQIHASSSNRNNSNLFGISSRTLRSVKTFAAVLGCVIMTWFPLIVTSLYQIFSHNKDCTLQDIIGTHLLVIGFSNSFLNPLIYAVGTKDFRSKVKMIFRSHCYSPTDSQVFPTERTTVKNRGV